MVTGPTTTRRHPGRGPRSVQVLRRARRRARLRRSLAALGPTSRRLILADGRALGFDDFGDPNGTPILFFHGFGSSRVVRHPDDDIAAQLGARIIAVDRPGIGISTRRPNRRVTDWPQDVEELLDRLDIERASILAWSGGGPYALACGWRIPERISVIGLISSPAPLSGVPGSQGYTWRRHRAMSRTADHAPWVIALAMWRWSRQQRADPEKQLDDAIAGMVEADRLILGDPAKRAVMIANAAEMWRQGNRGVYDEALCLARPWGFPIDGVSVPVRIWHGTRDRVVPVGMGRYIERTVAHAVATYYPNEAHHMVLDRWSEILSVIVAEARSGTAPVRASAPAGRTGEGRVPTTAREVAIADLLGLRDPAPSA
jgi:pimeloyl-ACP methyl ester carboxylesterase